MSGVSPLSGISGLSFDSTFLSPFFSFCLVLLCFLYCHFSANDPFSFPPRNYPRLLCMALAKQLVLSLLSYSTGVFYYAFM